MKVYTLLLLPETYDVVKLAPGTAVERSFESAAGLLAVIHTLEETTVVCGAGMITQVKDLSSGWRALKIAGTLDFELVGVLSGLLKILAQAEVSVFALSTYSTDIILLKGDRLQIAIEALKKAGHQVIE